MNKFKRVIRNTIDEIRAKEHLTGVYYTVYQEAGIQVRVSVLSPEGSGYNHSEKVSPKLKDSFTFLGESEVNPNKPTNSPSSNNSGITMTEKLNKWSKGEYLDDVTLLSLRGELKYSQGVLLGKGDLFKLHLEAITSYLIQVQYAIEARGLER